jgi:ABC-type nitrate/sulfonate/bicarbonate transport system substrate-binding protein
MGISGVLEISPRRMIQATRCVAADPFGSMALRKGFSLVFDLSQLGVPYTMHGIGTRKGIVREKRDIVIRFMKSYLEGIHLFKTNKELALNTLKKYARLDDLTVMQSLYEECSQRLIQPVPYPTTEGIQTIIDHLAKTRPQAKGLNSSEFHRFLDP